MDNTCCICGTVRNCGIYLDKVFENIVKIGSIFDKYEIIIFYDISLDISLEKLKFWQKKLPNMQFYSNKNTLSKYRTHNLANARNFLLNYVKKNHTTFKYFIMMDMDDVNAKNCQPENLKSYLDRTDWDGLSFNTSPIYYDIWALSKAPFTFSYNHFTNNYTYHNIIAKYIDHLLKQLPEDGLLSCISSFNGFSIYRTDKFLQSNYDGRPRPNLLPKSLLDQHKKMTKSNIIYKKYETLDGRYEDCEHRVFHILAIKTADAKIRISPKILFY
jgi:hypothetical protein